MKNKNFQIFSNFLVDKPVTYLFLLLIGSSFLVYFSHKSLDLETVTYLSIILINIIFRASPQEYDLDCGTQVVSCVSIIHK